MKRCTKCHLDLPLDRFGKHNGKKAAKSGLRPYCKDCAIKEYRLYKAKNPDKVAESQKSWRKSNPENMKAIGRRYQARHAESIAAYQKKYRESNAEAIKIQQADWRTRNKEYKKLKDAEWQRLNKEKVNLASHRRRARKNSVAQYFVSDADIRRISRDSCIYCGGFFQHIEHIVPLSRGGTHSIGNLAAACVRCNLSKGSLLVAEWKLRKLKYGY